jgi:hypothetical protein
MLQGHAACLNVPQGATVPHTPWKMSTKPRQQYKYNSVHACKSSVLPAVPLYAWQWPRTHPGKPRIFAKIPPKCWAELSITL